MRCITDDAKSFRTEIIAHETAVYRNPLSHSVTGDGTNLTDPQ